MSVIVGRALPDVRDGLKPVHRRVLYAMYDGGYRPDRGFSKCARVVGDVMGQYHPHGDTAIYDALGPARAAVVAALPAGRTARATSARRATTRPPLCATPSAGWLRWPWRWCATSTRRPSTSQPNYDGRTQEPRRPAEPVPEPARQRQLGHRGRHGHEHPAAQPARGRHRRAVVPRQPRGDDRRSCSRRCSSASRARTSRPAGSIVGRRGIEDAYRTGRGSITMRAVVEVEEIHGRTCLVVTELPYQVNPDNLALKIADLVKDGQGRRHRRHPGRGHRAARASASSSCSSATPSRRSCSTTSTSTPSCRTPSAPTCSRSSTASRARCSWTSSCGTGSSHQVEVIVRRTPLPAAQGRGARPHPARPAQGARPARRGHRADPRGRRRRTRRAAA